MVLCKPLNWTENTVLQSNPQQLWTWANENGTSRPS